MHRIRILEFLSKREKASIREISKNLHIPMSVVKSEVENLTKDGLVSVEDDNVKISERGVKELQDAKRIRG